MQIIKGTEILKRKGKKVLGRCTHCNTVKWHDLYTLEHRVYDKCQVCRKAKESRSREKDLTNIEDNPMLIWLQKRWI